MPQQGGPDLSEQPVIVDGIGQAHARQFGADGGGQLFYAHHAASVRVMTKAGHAGYVIPRPAGRWEMLVVVTLCLLPFLDRGQSTLLASGENYCPGAARDFSSRDTCIAFDAKGGGGVAPI
ncbi:hypothetical protein GCM10027081_55640 [Cupriavidus yeoncheonensis]